MGGLMSKLVVLLLIVSTLAVTISSSNNTLSYNQNIFNVDSDGDGVDNSADPCPESPLPTWTNQSIESILDCANCGSFGMDVKFDTHNNPHVVFWGTDGDESNGIGPTMTFLKYAIYDGLSWNFSYVAQVTVTDYENAGEGVTLVDTLIQKPLLQLDRNNLPHIVYYTFSGLEGETEFFDLRYATYQEIESDSGFNWHKSTITQRSMGEDGGCPGGGDCLINDIAGFELDSDNNPHIVYHNLSRIGEATPSNPYYYESTLHYSTSTDWLSWDTNQIYRGTNDTIMVEVSMTLGPHNQAHLIAIMPSTEAGLFEAFYLRYNGEDVIQTISIGFANNVNHFDRDHELRSSLTITIDFEDVIHMGYIDDMNRYTYATLEFHDMFQYSRTISTIDISTEPDRDDHYYYDLILIIGSDGTPHTLYTSFDRGPSFDLPEEQGSEDLGGEFFAFYSVFVDGEWNRHQVGVIPNSYFPGFALDNAGWPSIIHRAHNFVNWSELSLMSFRPIDSDDDDDGCLNFEDQFPTEPSEQFDSDEDGVGDNADVFPDDPSETHDTDRDGFGDEVDAFPTRITQWTDSDGDGYGDNFANSSWDSGLARPGELVPLAFKQDACPLLPGTSYLGTSSNGEGIVIYGCPDSDGDGYADIIESDEEEITELEDESVDLEGGSGLDLDLVGIILSLLIPAIAIVLGWYYSTRKRRYLESLIVVIGSMDNPLDLTTWFDLTSTDAILNGEINHAQLELLRTYYRRHHDHLTSMQNMAEEILPENK